MTTESGAGLLSQKSGSLVGNAEGASSSPSTTISFAIGDLGVGHLLENVERLGQKPAGDGGGGHCLAPPATDGLIGKEKWWLGLRHLGGLAEHETDRGRSLLGDVA